MMIMILLSVSKRVLVLKTKSSRKQLGTQLPVMLDLKMRIIDGVAPMGRIQLFQVIELDGEKMVVKVDNYFLIPVTTGG